MFPSARSERHISGCTKCKADI